MDRQVSPTILVVEDDPSIALLADEALSDEGYRVLVAHTVEEARALLATFRCGLVLTDGVGALSPAEAAFWGGLEAIRDAVGPTPVVTFSAHHPELFEGCERCGFAGLLPKPFDIDALVTVVRTLALPPDAG